MVRIGTLVRGVARSYSVKRIPREELKEEEQDTDTDTDLLVLKDVKVCLKLMTEESIEYVDNSLAQVGEPSNPTSVVSYPGRAISWCKP